MTRARSRHWENSLSHISHISHMNQVPHRWYMNQGQRLCHALAKPQCPMLISSQGACLERPSAWKQGRVKRPAAACQPSSSAWQDSTTTLIKLSQLPQLFGQSSPPAAGALHSDRKPFVVAVVQAPTWASGPVSTLLCLTCSANLTRALRTRIMFASTCCCCCWPGSRLTAACTLVAAGLVLPLLRLLLVQHPLPHPHHPHHRHCKG